MKEVAGKCLCGDVTFKACGEPVELHACHCSMCRQQNGGSAFIGLHTAEGVKLGKTDGLTWYQASDHGDRGFCKTCGATLFWRMQGEEKDFSVSVGTLAETDGLKLSSHIFTDEAPQYYTLPDDAPHKTGAQVLEEFMESQKHV